MALREVFEHRVDRVFRDRLGIAVDSADSDLFSSGALDSLVFVDLLLALEDEFDRRIPLEALDVDDFRSIAAISRLLERDGLGAGPSEAMD